MMKPLPILLLIVSIFTVGYFSGCNSVKVTQFKEYQAAVEKRDKLQTQLNAADIALRESQQKQTETRDKEVIKYVTVYRDRIEDPVIAECVRDSGILQLYDATVSAPGK